MNCGMKDMVKNMLHKSYVKAVTAGLVLVIALSGCAGIRDRLPSLNRDKEAVSAADPYPSLSSANAQQALSPAQGQAIQNDLQTQANATQAAGQSIMPATSVYGSSADTSNNNLTVDQRIKLAREGLNNSGGASYNTVPNAAIPNAALPNANTALMNQQLSPQTTQATAASIPTDPNAPGQKLAVIYFENGSSSISQRDMLILRDVGRYLQQNGGTLLIQGHASQDGKSSEEANIRASANRAKAIGDAMIKMGVPKELLKGQAMGTKLQIPGGEAYNRRVDIYLLS